MLSTGHDRKNDDADAVSVAIAARSAPRLNSAAVDGAVKALRAIVEHRDDLVKPVLKPVDRLHVVLTNLIPAGADRDLTAERAAERLRGIRPRDAAGKTLRSLAADLVAEIRQLDRRIAKAASDIQTAVTDSATTLTELCGIGALTAGKIIGRVGTIDRFRSAAAFATYTGTAPIDVSSGDVVRHRLSRAGDRQLNLSLHVMAVPRFGRTPPAGPTTYASETRVKVTKKRRDASNDGYPTSSTDNSAPMQTGWRQAREDTRGRLYRPARPAQTPHADASDKSLPGLATSNPTTDGHRPVDTERRRLAVIRCRRGTRPRSARSRVPGATSPP
ncbi:MAG: hypothetical protein NVS4B6_23360 [Mycobacterium sp.]